MTYDEAVEFLFSRLPMFTRIGAAAYKDSLGNIQKLCNALGNPEKGFKSIHLAGTNGKGSVSSMISSILIEEGLNTGLFTSPHLISFTERIRINGIEIPNVEVEKFVSDNQQLIEETEPSFFEVTTAMMFWFFNQSKIDISVIEAGMGGRLDSTNVIMPVVSVITNISSDHEQFLGNTPEKIAGEKAGIIKPGIPVVIGERDRLTSGVFEKVARLNDSLILFASDNWKVETLNQDLYGREIRINNQSDGTYADYFLDMGGDYQEKNIATVFDSLKILQSSGMRIGNESIRKGLANVRKNSGLRGRMEVLRTGPLVICDVGHNEAGLKLVFEQISKIKYKNLHVVFGSVRDKDINNILSILPRGATYYFVAADIPRALPAEELKTLALHLGIKGFSFPSVISGFNQALENSGTEDMIFVGGSTFVVAEVI